MTSRASIARPYRFAALVTMAVVLAATPRLLAGEQYDGQTEAKVLWDDPRAKQLSLSAGLGIFAYRSYIVGGWGLDMTYAAPYVMSVSAKVFATVRTNSDATDKSIRPFYELTAYLHLLDAVSQQSAKVRIYGSCPWCFDNGRYAGVPAKARSTFSMRGGVFSWGAVSPTAFAGLAFTGTQYLGAYLDELDTKRTCSSSSVLYLDAVFPTANQPGGPNDRVGAKLGFELKSRNEGSWWNGWGGFELGYLREELIGRFVMGLTL